MHPAGGGHSAGGPKQQPIDDSNKAAEDKSSGEAATAAVAFVTSITDMDIVLGRGRYLIQRPGNVAFRELCRTRKEEYLKAANRNVKDQIARELIQEVAKRKGRFLSKIETADEAKQVGVPQDVEEAWRVVGFAAALEKTKQTLRDKEYIKSRDRATKTAGASSDVVETRRAAETGIASNSMQPQMGHDRRSVSNSQTHVQMDPLPGSADESLLLLTLHREQNQIRQLQQHLSQLQYQQQLWQSVAPSGFNPYSSGRLLPEELLMLQSRHAVAPHLFHLQNNELGTSPHFRQSAQQHAFSLPLSDGQRLTEEQKSDTNQQDLDQRLAGILFGRNLPSQLSPMHSSTHLLHGFTPEIVEQQRMLQMHGRYPADSERPNRTDGGRFSMLLNPSAHYRPPEPAILPALAAGLDNTSSTFHRLLQSHHPPSGLSAVQEQFRRSTVAARAEADTPVQMSLLLRQRNMRLQGSSPSDNRERISTSPDLTTSSPTTNAVVGAQNASAAATAKLKRTPSSSAASSSSGETVDEQKLDAKRPAKKHKK